MTSHDVVGQVPAHLLHPQGRARGHAGPDGHRRAGRRHRAGHQDPRPADRDRQVVRRDRFGWGRPPPPRTPKAKCCRRFRPRRSPTPTSRPRSPRCAARSRRFRRRSARSRSAASAPTGSPARGRPSNWPPGRCASTGSRCWTSGGQRRSSTSTSRWTARAAPTSARWPATSAPPLGVGGHLTALRRTRVGRFGLDEARTLDALADEPRLSYTLDEACLLAFPRRDLTADEAESARHGRALNPAGIDGVYAAVAPDEKVISLLRDEGDQGKISGSDSSRDAVRASKRGDLVKAVRNAPPSVEVVEVDEPDGDGELVRIVSAGICASDLKYLQYGSTQIAGHEFAGVLAGRDRRRSRGFLRLPRMRAVQARYLQHVRIGTDGTRDAQSGWHVRVVPSSKPRTRAAATGPRGRQRIARGAGECGMAQLPPGRDRPADPRRRRWCGGDRYSRRRVGSTDGCCGGRRGGAPPAPARSS